MGRGHGRRCQPGALVAESDTQALDPAIGSVEAGGLVRGGLGPRVRRCWGLGGPLELDAGGVELAGALELDCWVLAAGC